MSADLDDVFSRMGQHIDAVPLAPAVTARRRGQRRSRARAMAAAAAAVCLIGAGAAAWRVHPADQERTTSPPVADRTTRPGGLPTIGDPVPFGGTTRFGMTGIAGQRAYAGWHDEDGTIKVVGADLATGAAAWPVTSLGTFDDFGGTTVLPQAVLTSVEHNDGTEPDRTMYVIDPASGATRWKLPFDVADDLVYYDDVLVFMSATTGVTTGFDWVTGRVRWSLAADADRPSRTLGMYLPADAKRMGPGGLPVDFRDRRLIQVTAGGTVRVRDPGSGALKQSLDGGRPDGPLVAYDGRLYGAEQVGDPAAGARATSSYRIRVTELGSVGGSRIAYTGPVGRRFEDLAPCGPDRLCVTDSMPSDETVQVASVDVAKRRELWRVAAPAGASRVQSLGTRVLVSGNGPAGNETALYDTAGRQRLPEQDRRARVGWLDEDTLISLPAGRDGAGADGVVAKVAAKDGRRTVLGVLSTTPSLCSWTPQRLACPTPTGLQLWDLTR